MKDRNVGVYETDSTAFEGDWGNVLLVDGLTAVSRGVGGGVYHLYLSGDVISGETYSISRERGQNPKFYNITTDELEVSGDTITISQTKTLATSITLFLRDE